MFGIIVTGDVTDRAALSFFRGLILWMNRHGPHGIGRLVMNEYCFTSLSAQSWQYRDRRKPEAGTMPYSYFE